MTSRKHSITSITPGPHRPSGFFKRVSTLSPSHIERMTDVSFFYRHFSSKIPLQNRAGHLMQYHPQSWKVRPLFASLSSAPSSLRIPLGARRRCVHGRRYLASRLCECRMYFFFSFVLYETGDLLVTFQAVVRDFIESRRARCEEQRYKRVYSSVQTVSCVK